MKLKDQLLYINPLFSYFIFSKTFLYTHSCSQTISLKKVIFLGQPVCCYFWMIILFESLLQLSVATDWNPVVLHFKEYKHDTKGVYSGVPDKTRFCDNTLKSCMPRVLRYWKLYLGCLLCDQFSFTCCAPYVCGYFLTIIQPTGRYKIIIFNS